MLTFRDMTLDDRDTVLPMVDAFYRSNAVDHPVPGQPPLPSGGHPDEPGGRPSV